MPVVSTVEIVMQLANFEAVAAQFGEIGPEQLLLGLLKFAEFPTEFDGAAVEIKEISAAVKEVGQALKNNGIDSTTARRQLRSLLGRGPVTNPLPPLHRTAECRAVCDVAMEIARKQNAETLTPLSLLLAVLQQPTETIRKVLGDKIAPVPSPPASTPLLDQHGRDLTRLVDEGKQSPNGNVLPACLALFEVMHASRRSVVLLEAAAADLPRILDGFALRLAKQNQDSPGTAIPRRLIDLRALTEQSGKRPEKRDLWRDVLEEAKQTAGLILVVDFRKSADPDVVQQMTEVARCVDLQTVQVLWPLSSTRYHELLNVDPEWKRRAHAMWSTPEHSREIPTEI